MDTGPKIDNQVTLMDFLYRLKNILAEKGFQLPDNLTMQFESKNLEKEILKSMSHIAGIDVENINMTDFKMMGVKCSIKQQEPPFCIQCQEVICDCNVNPFDNSWQNQPLG